MSNVNWKVATGIICSFGVFKDFRPSESFLTSYLIDPEGKNLTLEEINNEIYPIWTYSYLVILVIVLLITDLLRYKPIVILEAVSYIVTWSLLLFAYGVLSMQCMEICYGWATATEIAYYSYIYAAVTDTYYRRVSSFVRASSLAGRFLAASLGQILITFAKVSYFTLNIISMTNVCIAFVISLALPKVKVSFYFHRSAGSKPEKSCSADLLENTSGNEDCIESNDGGDLADKTNSEKTYRNVSFTDGLRFMWEDFRTSYAHKDVVLWSLWWATASTGNFQMANYIQNLWKAISPNRPRAENYNGAVDAVSMLFTC